MLIAPIRSALAGQYGATLLMLQRCLQRANDKSWLAIVGTRPFWHVAYHALFTTDLYLSPDEKAFQPPPFHREDYNLLGTPPWAPHKKIVADQPYDTPTLSAYVEACKAKAKRALGEEDETRFLGPSGFSCLKFTRLELHLYNIRHLQHHVGQLTACLRRQSGEAVAWALSETL